MKPAPEMLRRGDQLPHFDVSTVDGSRVRYAEVWQHRNTVLVSIDPTEPTSTRYAADVRSRAAEFDAAETVLVISPDRVAGLPCPGVVIADKWGEIVRIFEPAGGRLPEPAELLDWVRFVRMQCPECPP